MLPKKIFAAFLKKVINARPQVGRSLLAEESVIWGYRLFLDRDPESLQAVNEKLSKLSDYKELRREFIQSDEFKQKNPALKSPTLSGNEPPMLIEEVRSEVVLQDLFQHIQDSWKYLGEKEPYWSVLKSDKYLSLNVQENEQLFYDSGKYEVDRLFKFFHRNGIDHSVMKSCLEYGCGIGRIIRWLAERFETVYGYDISLAHLEGAEQYLNRIGTRNIILKHINQIGDIENLQNVDLIYSIIVLQHNPPPLIGLIIREFIHALNPGGIAFFQVPTYRLGYEFSLERYLSESTKYEMEMHVLPQSKVFEIVRQEGGKVIEVIEDDLPGSNYRDVSNTFLVQKG